MKILCSIAGLVALLGCTTASTNMFRAEQTATSTAMAAYTGYTNALYNGTLKISVAESNAVKEARLDFAASVGVAEAFRLAYETNSTVTTQSAAQAALQAALDSSSNLVWLINRIRCK